MYYTYSYLFAYYSVFSPRIRGVPNKATQIFQYGAIDGNQLVKQPSGLASEQVHYPCTIDIIDICHFKELSARVPKWEVSKSALFSFKIVSNFIKFLMQGEFFLREAAGGS